MVVLPKPLGARKFCSELHKLSVLSNCMCFFLFEYLALVDTFRLDVCVAAIEGAMDEAEKVDAAGSKGEKAPQKSAEDVAASVAADAFSVASSIVSGMTDMIKKMEDTKVADVSSV